MFYKGMRDLWEYTVPVKEGERALKEKYNVFYYEGEFYIHDRLWNAKGLPRDKEFQIFEETDDCLFAMRDIAPWGMWYIVDESNFENP